MALQYGPIAVLAALGAFLGIASLVAAWFLRPADSYAAKKQTYECGMEPVGEAWGRFFVRYYLLTLVFIIFEIEAVFLYPVAVVYKRLSAPEAMGFVPLVEIAVFIAILLVGLAYVWRKGDLEWIQEN